VDDAAVDLCNKFGGCKAGDVAEHVLWPAGFHGTIVTEVKQKGFSPQSHKDTEKTSKIILVFPLSFSVSL